MRAQPVQGFAKPRYYAHKPNKAFTRANTKPCPCEGCNERILKRHVFCGPHWFAITEMQRESMMSALRGIAMHKAGADKDYWAHFYQSALQNALETIRSRGQK
jgi:hypothetical protein